MYVIKEMVMFFEFTFDVSFMIELKKIYFNNVLMFEEWYDS